MTQSEFIKQYCENSGVKEQELNELGTFAMPCNCDYEGCQKWAMIRKGNLEHHIEFNMPDLTS